MSITAKELASKLGLSKSAVSLALNDKPGHAPVARLISANRTNDITRTVTKLEYRKRLCAEYGI